jgi:hypothetical protein
VQEDKDLIRLDELISGLGGTVTGSHSASPCGLLLEHLQAARRDRLGSMRAEYVVSLKQAKESIACILDKGVRAETKKVLQGLLDSRVPLVV